MKYAALAASVFTGEFFLKKYMEEQRQEEREILGGRILLKTYRNKGAALNFMEERPGLVKKICGVLLLFLGILWCLIFRKKENKSLLLGLGLVIGGGASNLYDRAARGYVIDYFSFRTPWRYLNQVVFNLSDLCIFLGGLLFVLAAKKRI